MYKHVLSLHQFFGVKSLVSSLSGGTRFFLCKINLLFLRYFDLHYFFLKKNIKKFGQLKKSLYLCIALEKARFGAVAQSVEQRTENPCVGGSIPSHTTKNLKF